MYHYSPYEVLGLAPDAPFALVKKAYRKGILTYHPDKNSTPEAIVKFKQVTEAYATISSSSMQGSKSMDFQDMPLHSKVDWEVLDALADAEVAYIDSEGRFHIDRLKDAGYAKRFWKLVHAIGDAQVAFRQAQQQGKSMQEALATYHALMAEKGYTRNKPTLAHPLPSSQA